MLWPCTPLCKESVPAWLPHLRYLSSMYLPCPCTVSLQPHTQTHQNKSPKIQDPLPRIFQFWSATSTRTNMAVTQLSIIGTYSSHTCSYGDFEFQFQKSESVELYVRTLLHSLSGMTNGHHGFCKESASAKKIKRQAGKQNPYQKEMLSFSWLDLYYQVGSHGQGQITLG